MSADLQHGSVKNEPYFPLPFLLMVPFRVSGLGLGFRV